MKAELLAPAGDIEAAYAALYYGADALYLGLKNFSARATATNFDENELNEITAYAHHLGRKVYVTINTIIKEDELSDVIKSLDMCSKYKVDAVILQDLGVANLIKTQYPELEMHASTQMAVHNREGALFLKNLGFSRVVLARELTLEEINAICEIENLETEVFIHGALCYSYSGVCQFSALEYNKSANRGKCIYPCRSVFEGDGCNKHIFSMKDLALEGKISELKATSLKIEGRKKSALYVAAVTDYYRRILDGQKPDKTKADNIKQIFSRPWCRFHFLGKSKDVVDPDFVGHRGLPVGKIENISKGKMILTPTHNIGRFDGLQIDVKGQEKPFGFSVQKLFQKAQSVFQAKAGLCTEIELPKGYPMLSKGMDVYLASSSEVKGSYAYEKPKPKEFQNKVYIDVRVEISPQKLKAISGDFAFELTGCFEKAQNTDKVYDSFLKGFQKTGDTIFELEHFILHNPDGLFVPASTINELRRGLYQKIQPHFKHGALASLPKQSRNMQPKFMIKTDCLENLDELDLNKFEEVIYLINETPDFEKLAQFDKSQIRIALPTICRHPEKLIPVIEHLKKLGYRKWEVSNYWGLEVVNPKEYDVSFGSFIYMLNTQALLMAQKIGAKRVSFAPEDTAENIAYLTDVSPLETTLVIYQDVPLFTSAVCIRKNDCAHCAGGKKWLHLSKGGQKFEALSVPCQTMLFNKNPFIFEDYAKTRPAFYELDFCYKPYTSAQVKAITDKMTF